MIRNTDNAKINRNRVTATDIAKALGISQSTVSRALSNGVVAPKTKRMILDKANELGYRPDSAARTLITGRSKMIGLVVSDIKNPFYPEVIERFAKEFRKRGYYLLFAKSMGDDIQEEDLTPLLDNKVEGAVVVAAKTSSVIVRQFNEYAIPVVLFNRYIQGVNCFAVSCNNRLGGEVVADTLIQADHHRLAFVSGLENTSTNQDRQLGYLSRIQALGYEPAGVVPGHYSYEGGYRAFRELMSKSLPPDAIFCANDIMALGALDAARSMGIRVPEDVSIIGFDDIPQADWSAYNLTTVRQPVERMILTAVDQLLNVIENDQSLDNVNVKLLRGELVVRGSVRGLNKEAVKNGTNIDVKGTS